MIGLYSELLGFENGYVFSEVIIVLFEFDDKYSVLRVCFNFKFEGELMGFWVLL